MTALPGPPGGAEPFRDELAAVLQLTDLVDRSALRRPPINALVDAEIESMVEYVRQHGRGELVLDRDLDSRARAGWRLATATVTLPSFLGLDAGPLELARVAVARLGKELGEDAAYHEIPAKSVLSATDLAVEVRDSIGLLDVRELDDRMSDRILATLDTGPSAPLRRAPSCSIWRAAAKRPQRPPPRSSTRSRRDALRSR
jgi:hypothetical protein